MVPIFCADAHQFEKAGLLWVDLSLVPLRNPRRVETHNTGGLASSSWEGVISLSYFSLAQFIPLFYRFLGVGSFVLLCTAVEGGSNSVEALNFYASKKNGEDFCRNFFYFMIEERCGAALIWAIPSK